MQRLSWQRSSNSTVITLAVCNKSLVCVCSKSYNHNLFCHTSNIFLKKYSTRWSWLPPAASVWQKITKTNIRIHWSLWEEFRAISNTVGTFDFWRTLTLHLIQILSAIYYAFSSFWSGVCFALELGDPGHDSQARVVCKWALDCWCQTNSSNLKATSGIIWSGSHNHCRP